MTKMSIEELIKSKYIRMYRAIMGKDIVRLSNLLDDLFSITHLNGKNQNKIEFIEDIKNGEISFYQFRHDSMDFDILNDDKIVFIGNSYVLASIYSRFKNYYNLRQELTFIKKDNDWKISQIIVSTY